MKSFRQFISEAKGTGEDIPSAHHHSLEVQPGKNFAYIRNTVSSKKFRKYYFDKNQFAQNIEPAGRYMNSSSSLKHARQYAGKDTEVGEHKFENPLYLKWGEGTYHDSDNWKQTLYRKYGKRGKRLSQAIRDDGHDGIVTVGYHNNKPHTSEIVDLTMFQPKRHK